MYACVKHMLYLQLTTFGVTALCVKYSKSVTNAQTRLLYLPVARTTTYYITKRVITKGYVGSRNVKRCTSALILCFLSWKYISTPCISNFCMADNMGAGAPDFINNRIWCLGYLLLMCTFYNAYSRLTMEVTKYVIYFVRLKVP